MNDLSEQCYLEVAEEGAILPARTKISARSVSWAPGWRLENRLAVPIRISLGCRIQVGEHVWEIRNSEYGAILAHAGGPTGPSAS